MKQPQSGVEGESPTALPLEGATRAPDDDENVYPMVPAGKGISDIVLA